MPANNPLSRWPSYDWLGKTLMALFLIICHFVVV